MRIGILHSDDDGQPQGGGATPSTVLAQYGGDAVKIAEKLATVLTDNYDLREQRRELKRQLAEAQRAAPTEGARVLSVDEAAAYDAYAALGTPAEVQAALDAKAAAEGKLTALERDATLRDVRDATGYDLEVLRDIGGAEWQYTISSDPDSGARVVTVKDGDTELPIDQHPKVQKFLPALKPQASAPAGTPFPRQSAGTPPSRDLAGEFIARQEARRAQQPNPLMKQGAS